MIESSVRWILAFVAALVAVILVAPLAAAATPGAPSGASLTCDSHGATATAVVTAAERGPPAGLYQYTTYDAVDRRSDGASVRPDRATPSAAITYTHHTPLVQVAGAAAMTQEQAGVSDGCSAVFDRGGVAANTGRGAALTERQIGTTMDDVLDGANFLKQAKATQYAKPGGFGQANSDFNALTQGVDVIERGGGLRTATLSNGTKVNVRPFSSGNDITLEVVTPGNPALKIRYTP